MTRMRPEAEPVQAWGAEDTPDAFIWGNTTHQVLEVVNRWRVHTLWWEPRQAIWREYLKLVTDTGMLCVLYRDLEKGGWFLARLYD